MRKILLIALCALLAVPVLAEEVNEEGDRIDTYDLWRAVRRGDNDDAFKAVGRLLFSKTKMIEMSDAAIAKIPHQDQWLTQRILPVKYRGKSIKRLTISRYRVGEVERAFSKPNADNNNNTVLQYLVDDLNVRLIKELLALPDMSGRPLDIGVNVKDRDDNTPLCNLASMNESGFSKEREDIFHLLAPHTENVKEMTCSASSGLGRKPLFWFIVNKMDNLSLATEMYDSDPQYYQRVIQRSKTDFLRMAMRKRDYKLAERLINAGHFISLEPEIYNMSPLLLSLSAKDDLRLFKKMLGNIRSRDLEKGKGIPLALALLEAPEPFQLYVDRMAALNTDGKNTFVCELITATKDDRASFCKLASNEEKAYVSRLCGRFGC